MYYIILFIKEQAELKVYGMKGKRLLSTLLVFALLVIGSNCVPVLAHAASQDTPIIEDGVYFIENKKSGNHLMVQDFSISENANVTHCALDMDENYLASWKIHYVGYGFYTIRPMHKLNMALSGLAEDVVIQDVGTDDTFEYLSGLYANALWTIEEDDLGLVIKNVGISGRTLYAENASKETYPETLLADYESDIPHCHWELQKVEDPPSGTILYQNGAAYYGICVPMLKGQTIELSSIGVIPTAYSANTISQAFYWTSSAPDIISVNPETGALTASNNVETESNNGSVTITGVSASGDSISFSARIMRAIVLGYEPLNEEYMEEAHRFGLMLQDGWNIAGYDSTCIEEIDADIVRAGIADSDIVCIIGHGKQHQINMQGEVYIVDETVDQFPNAIQIADLDFSNTKLCVVNSCLTACRYDSSMNVCRNIYREGAECVLGWASPLYFDDAVIWQQRFQGKLAEGYTVEMAVRYANSFLYSAFLPEMCDSCDCKEALDEPKDPNCDGCAAITNNPQYLDYSDIKNNRIYGNGDLVISEEPASSIDFGSTYKDLVALGIEYQCSFRTEGSGFDLETFNRVLALFNRSDMFSMYKAVYTPTGDGYDDFVLDFIYEQFGNGPDDYTGQVYGYTVIVEDNRIVGVRDNRYPSESE